MHKSFLFLSVSALVLVNACSMAPRFEQPKMELGDAFKENDAYKTSWKEAQPAEAEARGNWWEIFNDPFLNDLQQQAVQNSPTLAQAAARLQSSRATVRATRANLLPDITATASPRRVASSAASLGLPAGTETKPRTLLTARGDLSYEIDLFGRLSDATAAARLNAAAQQALYEQALLQLHADIASSYFTLRILDSQRATIKETLDLREKTVKVIDARFETGDISELDVTRAKGDLAQTQSDLSAIERERAAEEHALAILLGRTPGQFTYTANPLAGDVPQIPVGLPSVLLERRPDITAAQKQMQAANKRIGIARAAFFPVLSLTASGGTESSELSDIFKWSSRTWALAPALTMPIFEGGRNLANLDISKAGYEEAVGRYREQVLVAFKDVEDQLSSMHYLNEQKTSQYLARDMAKKAEAIAQARYDVGEGEYLELLDAQRTRLTAERLAIAVQGERFNTTIRLIRALGGGWVNATPVTEKAAVVEQKPISQPVIEEKAEKNITPVADSAPEQQKQIPRDVSDIKSDLLFENTAMAPVQKEADVTWENPAGKKAEVPVEIKPAAKGPEKPVQIVPEMMQ